MQYFFSFFSFGKEALNVLRILVEDSTAKQIPEDFLKPLQVASSGSSRNSIHAAQDVKSGTPPLRISTPVLGDHVKATLSPHLSARSGAASPRLSADFGRGSMDIRRSIDLNKFSRRSIDLARLNT